MQPYFFPYLGYFGLIAATDRWVVFDTPQYMRRSWVNRNRVVSSGADGWKYLCAPVRKAARETSIGEIRLANVNSLRTDVLRNLDEYERRNAPAYAETAALVDDCLNVADDRLCSLLVQSLQKTCDHLQLPFSPELFSQLSLPIGNVGPGEWALKTAAALGASEYINPPGGRELFNPAEFERLGIRLSFLEHDLPEYSQQRAEFLAGLSIIDVLMWNGRQVTRQMIDRYRIVTAGELAVTAVEGQPAEGRQVFEINRNSEVYCWLRYHLAPQYWVVAEPQPGYFSEQTFCYRVFDREQLLYEMRGDFRELRPGSLVDQAQRIVQDLRPTRRGVA